MSQEHGIGGFLDYEPTEIDNFRGIVLFGMNTASYKFALAKSLIDLVQQGKDRATLEELAVPFSTHLTEHLAHSPRQIKAASSKFLDTCRDFNDGKVDRQGRFWE